MSGSETEVEVWPTGTVAPSSSSGAEGEPGSTSTKKFPSSKMRGRIFSSASRCSGNASSLSFIVTVAASVPSAASTFVTSPTSTPAMRTTAPGPRF
jgi:hypothetical protein